ncbi:hypothetical protein AMTR_s00046p00084270 [Amborella trichopoda]|uniref:Uncharacterized protein n=1 Tax=Amborella trichopoda TaxID=13333 RepID=U5D693_AMBTC|nr:hypothetical protein AMTR_s00046p00084270 [Amborella trichopoda]
MARGNIILASMPMVPKICGLKRSQLRIGRQDLGSNANVTEDSANGVKTFFLETQRTGLKRPTGSPEGQRDFLEPKGPRATGNGANGSATSPGL